VTFDPKGNLVVADTGIGSLVTYRINADGTVTQLDAVSSTQAGTCRVAPAGGHLYTSNAGSATVSGYHENGSGQLTLLGQTATDPGTVDASASASGQFLYVQTGGNGIVDEFDVHANGTLTTIGSVTVAAAAGGEGIIALIEPGDARTGRSEVFRSDDPGRLLKRPLAHIESPATPSRCRSWLPKVRFWLCRCGEHLQRIEARTARPEGRNDLPVPSHRRACLA